MPQYCYFCTTITPYYLSSLSLILSHNNSQHSSKAQQVITSMIATERIALQFNDTTSPSSPLNTKNETHFSTENEGSADTWRKGAEQPLLLMKMWVLVRPQQCRLGTGQWALISTVTGNSNVSLRVSIFALFQNCSRIRTLTNPQTTVRELNSKISMVPNLCMGLLVFQIQNSSKLEQDFLHSLLCHHGYSPNPSTLHA